MRVVIADSTPMFRAGLRTVVAEFDTTAEIVEAETAEELQILVRRLRVDLILTSFTLPADREDMTDDPVLSAIATAPDHAIVVVIDGTGPRSCARLRRAIDAGVRGHLPRAADRDAVLAMLQTVTSGNVYFPAAFVATNGAPEPAESSSTAAATRLTPTQRSVLGALMTGASNKDIARELGLAEATVKVHVAAILRALNVHSRAQALIVATELGLSPPQPQNSTVPPRSL